MEKIWKWSVFFKFEIREFIAVQLIKKKDEYITQNQSKSLS